jgi:hypothetical protein
MVTRNVVFSSDLGSGKARAHILFGGHAYVSVNYAAMVDMGRTSVALRDDTVMDANGLPAAHRTKSTARYALHAHHIHEPITFHGNAIFPLRLDTVQSAMALCCMTAGAISKQRHRWARATGIFRKMVQRQGRSQTIS